MRSRPTCCAGCVLGARAVARSAPDHNCPPAGCALSLRARHRARSLGCRGRQEDHPIHLGVAVVLLLVLFGSVPTGRLLLLLAVIAAGRISLIGAEALRKRWTESDWRALHDQLVHAMGNVVPEQLALDAVEMGLGPNARPGDLARAIVDARRRMPIPIHGCLAGVAPPPD